MSASNPKAELPTSESRLIKRGLEIGSYEGSDGSAITISPPPNRIEVSLGATVSVHLLRGIWPWSTSIGLSPEGIVVIQSVATAAGDLSLILRAVSVGEVAVQMHDYVDAENYPDGRIPRAPNRTWALRIVVIE